MGYLACVLEIKALVEAAVPTLLQDGQGQAKGDADSARDAQGGASDVRENEEPIFNSVLVNRYADGRSQIKWHADDEHCYGSTTSILIASVSLGAARYFELRRKPR